MVRAGGPAEQRMAECDVRLTLPWPAVGRSAAGGRRPPRRRSRPSRPLAACGPRPHEPRGAGSRAGQVPVGGRPHSPPLVATARSLTPPWRMRCGRSTSRRCTGGSPGATSSAGACACRPAIGAAGVIARERTILTTDVVGSTTSNARLGDVLYLEQLRRSTTGSCGRGLEEFHGRGDQAHRRRDQRGVRRSPADADALCPRRAGRTSTRGTPGRARAGPAASAAASPTDRSCRRERDLFGLVQSEAARVCAAGGAGRGAGDGARGRGPTTRRHRRVEPRHRARCAACRTEVEVFRLADGDSEKVTTSPEGSGRSYRPAVDEGGHMGDGMPYHLEKGPFLRIVERNLNR